MKRCYARRQRNLAAATAAAKGTYLLTSGDINYQVVGQVIIFRRKYNLVIHFVLVNESR